ncbi:MAG: ABC transporter permease [Firmicutes bacterium]|nr:ABC transporter permease [Bacillota bacterium]MDD4694501.1 ABC transporter permease [Bacillota bacterium]
MSNVFHLCKRNVLIFIRDRSSVFFSLLAVFIIIGLYALFLGDIVVSSVSEIVGEHARYLMDSWIMAGTLAVTSITTTLGAFGILIDDRDRKISNDFKSSPIKRTHILSGYILSAWIIGVLISILGLLLAEIYIVVSGGRWLELKEAISLIGVMMVSVFSSTAMMLFFVSFFKSSSSFGVASSVMGTLIGFLTGIYVPIGQLPNGVQTVTKFFPPSYSGSLYRKIMMDKPFSLANLPEPVLEEMKIVFGVSFSIKGSIVSTLTSVLVILFSGVVFFGLALIRLDRKDV